MAEDLRPKILELVRGLSDGVENNWMRMVSERDAADAVLLKMSELGIIKHREHRLGGHVWIFDGQIFGRTDGVALPNTGMKPIRSSG